MNGLRINTVSSALVSVILVISLFNHASPVEAGTDNPFLASLELSSLDGTNGFVLNGIAETDFSGISVSLAGDVNGDGIDDLAMVIVSAPFCPLP